MYLVFDCVVLTHFGFWPKYNLKIVNSINYDFTNELFFWKVDIVLFWTNNTKFLKCRIKIIVNNIFSRPIRYLHSLYTTDTSSQHWKNNIFRNYRICIYYMDFQNSNICFNNASSFDFHFRINSIEFQSKINWLKMLSFAFTFLNWFT